MRSGSEGITQSTQQHSGGQPRCADETSTLRTGRQILIVDDDPAFCELLKTLLTLSAHQVQTANGAKEALELVKPGRFDLVLTDYNMPGMDGDALAAAIKALDPTEPVVLVTGDVEFLSSRGARLANVDAIIAKAFNLEELRRAVSKVFTALDAGGLEQLRHDRPATGQE